MLTTLVATGEDIVHLMCTGSLQIITQLRISSCDENQHLDILRGAKISAKSLFKYGTLVRVIVCFSSSSYIAQYY